MATPYTITASVSFSPSSGQPSAARPVSGSGNFGKKQDDRYELTGAGTKTVTFDADVKAVLIHMSSGTSAINVRINGGTDDLEVTAGGFIAYSNPTPGTGITSVALVHTADAVIDVIGLS